MPKRFASPKVAGLLLLTAWLTVTPSTAFASTIQVLDMDWSKAMAIYLKADGVEEQGWVGAIKIRLNGTFDRTAFCVDLFTNINLNNVYNTTLLHPDVVTNGARAAWLMNTVVPTITAPEQGAALQMAIWDIVHDNGNGFSTGRVQAATANPTPAIVITLADQFLALSLGHSADAFVYLNSYVGSGVPAQTLMSPTAMDGGPVATPEPGTVVMMGAGLALICVGIRRRRAD